MSRPRAGAQHSALRYRRQPPIRGGRDALPALVLGQIRDAVDRDARRYGVSRSWVVAVILAHAYGIEDQAPIPGRRI